MDPSSVPAHVSLAKGGTLTLRLGKPSEAGDAAVIAMVAVSFLLFAGALAVLAVAFTYVS
jgi:hypothetical protein